MKKSEKFENIIDILKAITPHSEKLNVNLFSEYSKNIFKFRSLIKQLNNIINSGKSSKNRNLITNFNDNIIKKLEEFLLSSENFNLSFDDLLNKIIEITSEEANKNKSVDREEKKAKEEDKQKEENRRKIEEEEKKKIEQEEQDIKEAQLKEERENKEKQDKEKEERERKEREDKEKKEKEQKEKKQKEEEKKKEKEEKAKKEKEEQENKDNKKNDKEKVDKIKKILEAHNIKIENGEQNEKFAEKVLKNKEKITLAQEVLKNNQVKDKKEAENKIQSLNSYIASLQRLLSFIEKPAVINLISYIITQLKSQVSELSSAVNTLTENGISK